MVINFLRTASFEKEYNTRHYKNKNQKHKYILCLNKKTGKIYETKRHGFAAWLKRVFSIFTSSTYHLPTICTYMKNHQSDPAMNQLQQPFKNAWLERVQHYDKQHNSALHKSMSTVFTSIHPASASATPAPVPAPATPASAPASASVSQVNSTQDLSTHPVYSEINWSSDHTPVTFSVSQTQAGETNIDQLPIRVMTWNKMNKCHSKKANNDLYNNNPWDFDEDLQQYELRVEDQRKFLLDSIAQAEKDGKDLHVICLQEVNDLVELRYSPNSPNLTKINTKFENELKKLGWGIIKSRSEDQCKALVTLYNKKRLDYKGQRGVLTELTH